LRLPGTYKFDNLDPLSNLGAAVDWRNYARGNAGWWHNTDMVGLSKQSAFLVSAALLFLLCLTTVPTKGGEVYYVNGRQVASSKYEAYRLTQSAIKHIGHNNPQLAIRDLQRALAVDPTLAEAHSMMGVALARLGKLEQAELQLQMAIVSNYDLPAPRLNLAGLYQCTGKLSDAVRMYNTFLRDFPDTKQSVAIQDRIKLLEAEIKRQEQAGEHDDNRYDTSSYLGNVTAGGAKRWPDSAMPIKVYMSPGDGLTNYHSEYEHILEQSFREWETCTHGKVRIRFCGSPEEADITCEWIDDPAQLASSAEGGESQVRCIRNGICKAHVILSVIDAGSPFPLTDNLVRTLCLHEVGHSLGLLGHSANPKDIMFCTAPIIDEEEHLSKRDVATINNLYDLPLDQVSMLLAYLEHETHGNAFNLIRIALIMLSAVIAAGIAFAALTKKRKKKSK
jgi:predicted Zn-dependent protease